MINLRKSLGKVKSLLGINQDLELICNSLNYNNKVNFLNQNLINSKESGITTDKYFDRELIVSLTTFGSRLSEVYLTIESIMQQSRKPNRIVLWLSDELKRCELPKSLQIQVEKGLEICYCEDIRSYKKLIPSLEKFPESVIITIDDDVIYEVDMIDKLVIGYLHDQSKIYYNRGHKIKLKPDGFPKTYSEWEWESPGIEDSQLFFPTGVAGVLYPPGSLNEEVFNKEVFSNICQYADDIWFKAMSLLNNTVSKKASVKKSLNTEYLINPNVQDLSLGKINNHLGQNDVQLKAVFDKYNLYSLLK